MFTRLVGLNVLALAVLVAQCACVTTTSSETRRHYGRSNATVGIDPPSATCRHNPSARVALYGKEMASTTAVLKGVIDETTKQSIEEELNLCEHRLGT